MIKQSHSYADIEQKTRAFLETLQKQEGPPIYTLSPKEARAVLSNLHAAPVAKNLLFPYIYRFS